MFLMRFALNAVFPAPEEIHANAQLLLIVRRISLSMCVLPAEFPPARE